jgi:hypothetical protein
MLKTTFYHYSAVFLYQPGSYVSKKNVTSQATAEKVGPHGRQSLEK